MITTEITGALPGNGWDQTAERNGLVLADTALRRRKDTTMEAKRESQGFMYMAKRPCGKVSAMAWDDAGYEKSTAKSVAEWLRRGDKVERVEVFKGDPVPEMICRPKCDNCKTPNTNAIEDEEWLMMQEDEEGDEPFCNCTTGHSIEETDWNQCDSCGKPIYDEEVDAGETATNEAV